jgi:hypothetical protein
MSNVIFHNPEPVCPSLCYYDNLMGDPQDYYSHSAQDDALDGVLDLYDLIEEAVGQ